MFLNMNPMVPKCSKCSQLLDSHGMMLRRLKILSIVFHHIVVHILILRISFSVRSHHHYIPPHLDQSVHNILILNESWCPNHMSLNMIPMIPNPPMCMALKI